MSEEIKFKRLTLKDEDYIVGGAKTISGEVPVNAPSMKRTDVCNCYKFKPANNGLNLTICDNCKFAGAKSDESSSVYCLAQRM